MKARAIYFVSFPVLMLLLFFSPSTAEINGFLLAGNTIYVGPNETYKKIQDALDAAAEGDTIVVRNGTYDESIQIAKSITLRAENKHQAIIGDGSGSEGLISIARYLSVSGIIVEGFKLNTMNEYGMRIGSPNNDYIATDVSIKNNYFFNRKKSNILTEGRFKNLIIQGNKFENSEGVSLDIGGTGNIEIDSNEILNTINLSSIRIKKDFDGNALIKNNTIKNVPQPGIRIYSNNVTIDGNLLENSKVGISINSHCDSILIINNQILKTQGDGISIGDSTIIDIIHNLISESSDRGIHIEKFNSVRISGNEISNNAGGIWEAGSNTINISDSNYIHHNSTYGISIENGTTGQIVNNIIEYNSDKGINIRGNINVEGNIINGNAYVGISMTGNGTIKDNIIDQNDGPGIEIWNENEKIRIENNHIINNSAHGVLHRNEAIFLNNLISGNGSQEHEGHGIISDGPVTLLGNTISQNTGMGLWVYEGVGHVDISDNNIISNNYLNGILIDKNNNSIIQNNTISGNGLADNAGGGIILDGAALVKKNSIFDNAGNGIQVLGDAGLVEIVNNTKISNNGLNGVTIDPAEINEKDVVIRENHINDNGLSGIYVNDFTTGFTISDNPEISGNVEAAWIRGSNGTIVNNRMINNSDVGLAIGSTSMADSIQSNIIENNLYGIYISTDSRHHFIKSNYIRNNDRGIGNRGGIKIRNNFIENNLRGIIVYEEGNMDAGENNDTGSGGNTIAHNEVWNIVNVSPDTIKAFRNWWDLYTQSAIDSTIRDDEEDSYRGPVLFYPFIPIDTTSSIVYVSPPISISGPYPNPFSETTKIYFKLENQNFTSLYILDINGNRIKTLSQNENLEESLNCISWNGQSDSGQFVSNGLYFFVFQTEKSSISRKVFFYK